jgi:hypothetical protein
MRRTHRKWRRGEELKFRCGREENGEKRERVAAGSFSSTLVARGSEGKKKGGPAVCPHGRGRRRRERAPGATVGSAVRPGTAPGHQARAVALSRNRGERWGAADRWGRDELRAQCQGQGAGGRGVSDAARRRGADRRARPAQCRAARFEMDSMIFTDSNRFKNL